MASLQVLVATMHQGDLSIAEIMNIRCSAVIANQADREETVNKKSEYGELKMITTPTRGVGLNRNIALMAASADILLFADDDVTYNDDMPARVLEAFEQLPEADVIVFGMDMVKDGAVFERRETKTKRLHVRNSMRFGTYRLAVRRSALIDKNITFHQRFGGGCDFSSGEDTLFIKACFDKGLKVYSYSYNLGRCCKDTSSWFVGHNEKYFYDKGVLLGNLFPKSVYLMVLYFGIRFKRETELGVFKRLRLMYKGVRGSMKMKPYQGDK
jgi:glycosyltransferase involved in cell wall biosynthesis